MSFARIATVALFEVRRTATLARMAWWAVLALFPPALITLLVWAGSPIENIDVWTGIFFTLFPSIVCVLGSLLWSSPWLQSEIEDQTWTYLALRPHGKVTVLLGKYLTAVMWCILWSSSFCWAWCQR